MDLQIPSLELPQETQEEVVDTTLNEGDSLASPFLAKIPEQDRAIVEKYIKDWDSGVTKKFQALHTQYEPYKNLGDFDKIQQSLEIIKILEEDPQLFYQNLAELLQMNDGEDEMEYDNQELEAPGELDPRDSQIADLKAAVEAMSGNFEQMQNAKVEEQQMAELDSYMKEMHTTHGDFDEDWVLLQISRGIDPNDAIKSWNSLINDRVSSQQKKGPPNLIQGSGSSPGGQVDPSKFSPQQRKDYVAAMLAGAQQ